jgi:catechol 2,3-dioxygenase-like lactoylglutathione lyase family enzyme
MRIRNQLFSVLLSMLAWCPDCLAQAPVASMRPSLVALQVVDLDASTRWYTDNLGFQAKERKTFPDHGLRLAMLVREDFALELVENAKTLRRSQLLAGKGTDITGFAKITFSVPDVEPMFRRLERQGATFAARLRDSNTTPGDQFFIVLDNEGNWLQFVGRK